MDQIKLQEHYKILTENSQDILFVMDTTGIMRYVSPVTRRMLGYNPDEIPGTAFLDYVHPDDKPNAKSWLNRLITQKKNTEEIQYRVRTKDGSYRWHISKAIPYYEDGRLKGFSGTARDITLQQQAMEAIRHSRELMHYIIQHSNGGVAVHDRDLNYIYVSQRYLDQYGLSGQSVIGKHHYEVFPDLPMKWREVHQKTLKGEIFRSSQDEYIREDGETEWTRWECRPWYETDGQIGGIVVYTEVITDLIGERERLRISEEKYRRIADNISDVVWTADLNLKMDYVSPSIHKLVGLTAEEFLKLPVEKRYPPETIEMFRQLLRDELDKEADPAADRERTRIIDAEHLTIDGRTLKVSIHASFIRDKKGSPCGILGVTRDITEKKKAEERFYTYINFSPTAVFISNSLGHYTYVNPSACRLLGYSEQELLGMTIQDVAHPDDQAANLNALETLLKGASINRELTLRHKSGKEVFVILSAVSLDEGTLVGFCVDVTERKLAEIRLAESEARFKSLHNASFGGIFIHIGGIIQDCNMGLSLITGYSQDELIGMDALLLAEETYRDEIKNKIVKGWEKPYEIMGVRKDGSLFPALLEARNVPYKGKPARTVEVRDITEQKEIEQAIRNRNEEYAAINEEYVSINEELRQTNEDLLTAKEKAQESDRLKSAFLANVSHEIRTPMNGILGFLELLSQPGLDEDQHSRFTEIVNQSGQRLLDTINDIVEVSKIESGQVQLQFAEVKLDDLLAYYHSFFLPQARKKGLELILHADIAGIESRVISDRHKLDGILMNLLKNAIKFTHKGKIELGAYREGSDWVIYVKDTGTGIPKERHKAIFERFVQADLQLTLPHEGSGLGLSIVSSYVDMLGGKLNLESEPGKGSCFSIRFPGIEPAVVSEPESEPGADYQAKHADETDDKPLILIAEDDHHSYLYLEAALSARGVRLIRAENGLEAVEAFEQNPDIKLILMDLKMPGMDGLEATRIIRNRGARIPIVAQTAYAFEGDREVAVKAGCNDYLSKPIAYEALIRCLNKHLT